jgi:hypothetical protein
MLSTTKKFINSSCLFLSPPIFCWRYSVNLTSLCFFHDLQNWDYFIQYMLSTYVLLILACKGEAVAWVIAGILLYLLVPCPPCILSTVRCVSLILPLELRCKPYVVYFSLTVVPVSVTLMPACLPACPHTCVGTPALLLQWTLTLLDSFQCVCFQHTEPVSQMELRGIMSREPAALSFRGFRLDSVT